MVDLLQMYLPTTFKSSSKWKQEALWLNPNAAGIFSGLILKELNTVRQLIFKLCLPQDLKICLILHSPQKNNYIQYAIY